MSYSFLTLPRLPRQFYSCWLISSGLKQRVLMSIEFFLTISELLNASQMAFSIVSSASDLFSKIKQSADLVIIVV